MHWLRPLGRRLTRASYFVTALACCLAVGCGGGPSLYRISGNATFAGKPIPTGKIYFNPDSAKGSTGATGFADIKDGKYDTSAAGGRGAIGGAMIVRIEGADGIKIDEERPGGNPLFPAYETAVELPKSGTTKDFDVPANAASAQPTTAAPQVVP